MVPSISDDLEALEELQIFEVDNRSPVEPDIGRASDAANPHARASNKSPFLKYSQNNLLSQALTVRRRGYVWLTGCCLGVYISGGDMQFHSTYIVWGFKKKKQLLQKDLVSHCF